MQPEKRAQAGHSFIRRYYFTVCTPKLINNSPQQWHNPCLYSYQAQHFGRSYGATVHSIHIIGRGDQRCPGTWTRSEPARF